jgi:pimeloyl-ACP methyl ester carboxylesterase
MVLSHFGHDLRGIDGPSLSMEGSLFLDASAEEFEHTVSSDSNLPAPTLDTAGDFFYDQFASRLASLNGVSGWNAAVSRASVEDYVTTSSARLSVLSQTSAPVIAVHAADDPVVPYSEFQSFAQAQASNPSVLTLGTDDGSHCGFLGVYGAQWVADLINRALTLTATSNTK